MEIRAKGRVRVKVWCVHNEIVIYDQRWNEVNFTHCTCLTAFNKI
jgi:uncharacterized protein YqjF (DUF2071 family)